MPPPTVDGGDSTDLGGGSVDLGDGSVDLGGGSVDLGGADAPSACDEDAGSCPACSSEDADGDGVSQCESDCDDTDPTRYPGNTEFCDGRHDEDCDPTTYGRRDADGDGVSSNECCNEMAGSFTCGTDCNDAAATVNPTMPEVCDGRDNDCNGLSDDGLPPVSSYPDCDGDGFGASGSTAVTLCSTPPGPPPCGGVLIARWSTVDTDCADANPSRHPGQAEVCDLEGDNDCDPTTHPFDADMDGHDRASCGGDDCDDDEPLTYLDAPEPCNGSDNNCSSAGVNDEDVDGDGHIPPGLLCVGETYPRDDCDDRDAARHGGAPEVCNGFDDDCADGVDELPDAALGCALANAESACRGAQCAVGSCTRPYADCDGDPLNGCEIDLQSSDRNCGGCGLSCATGSTCRQGLCDTIVAIEAGYSHTCVLFSRGSMGCWGYNFEGQLGNGATSTQTTPTAVTGLSDGAQMDAGGEHSCAVRASGAVSCWGRNTQGQLGDGTFTARVTQVPVIGVPNAVEVVTGSGFSCARLATGAVQCWGDNARGQLGDGTFTPRTTPVLVAGLLDAVSLAAGVSHTCAVRAGGGVACWGRNDQGQLGDGTTSNRNAPVDVPGIVDASQATAGAGHSCSLSSTGMVRCWGSNTLGQMGNGTLIGPQPSPTAVGGVAGATFITGSSNHTCAIVGGARLWCWGDNSSGQIGNGASGAPVPTPAIHSLSAVSRASAGGSYTCVVASGHVQCWGSNARAQLGDGTVTPLRVAAAPVLNLDSDLELTAGMQHTCVRRASGDALCWGRNSSGQLGDGSVIERRAPAAVVGLADAIEIAAGTFHTCALRASGRVACWGTGSLGQLGLGALTSTRTPVDVPALLDAVDLAVGTEHTCVVRAAGTVSCWGSNRNQQIALPSGIPWNPRPADVPVSTAAVEISAGAGHTCARLIDGTVECWGGNIVGQLGDGSSSTSRATPGPVTGILDAKRLYGGSDHSCVLRANGTASCWGYNAVGQLGDGTRTTSGLPTVVVGVRDATEGALGGLASMDGHTCVIRAAGLACWGSNTAGQLGDGTNIPSSVPTYVAGPLRAYRVALGGQHTCATIGGGRVICWGNNSNGQLGSGPINDRNLPLLPFIP